MALALTILKWIGLILLIVLILLILIGIAVVFVPVRYVVECKTASSVRVGVSATWFLRAVKLHKSMTDSRFYLYLFGIRLRGVGGRLRAETDGNGEKPSGKAGQNRPSGEDESRVSVQTDYDSSFGAVGESRPSEKDEEPVVVQTDYEQPEEKKVSGKKKKSFSFDRISSIIKFIRDEQNKKGFQKLRRELAALFRYLMPHQVRGRILFGTGDPCTAGWVLGVVSMVPAAYSDGLSIVVDFEDKKLDVDTYVRGHMHLIYFIRMFIRGYLDADIKAVIHKIMDFL